MSSYAESGLRLLKLLPRVSLNNLVRNPYVPEKVSLKIVDRMQLT